MPGYVDTNVLVRLLVRDAPQQAHTAVQLVRDNVPVRVAGAVIIETAFVLEHVYNRSRATIAQALTGVVHSPHLIVDESVIWVLAFELYVSPPRLHLVDCYLAAKALTDRVPLHTLDQGLDKVVQRRRAMP